MKGTIKVDHATTDKYTFAIIGLPPLTATKVSGLEEEIKKLELPDGTAATTGNTGSSEITIMIPNHHSVEIAAMELWKAEGKDPVSATYKKSGVVLEKTVSGKTSLVTSILGVWVTKSVGTDHEMKPDAEAAYTTYTLSIDTIIPS